MTWLSSWDWVNTSGNVGRSSDTHLRKSRDGFLQLLELGGSAWVKTCSLAKCRSHLALSMAQASSRNGIDPRMETEHRDGRHIDAHVEKSRYRPSQLLGRGNLVSVRRMAPYPYRQLDLASRCLNQRRPLRGCAGHSQTEKIVVRPGPGMADEELSDGCFDPLLIEGAVPPPFEDSSPGKRRFDA